MSQGAAVNSVSGGLPMLSMAVANAHTDAIGTLLENGACVNKQAKRQGLCMMQLVSRCLFVHVCHGLAGLIFRLSLNPMQNWTYSPAQSSAEGPISWKNRPTLTEVYEWAKITFWVQSAYKAYRQRMPASHTHYVYKRRFCMLIFFHFFVYLLQCRSRSVYPQQGRGDPSRNGFQTWAHRSGKPLCAKDRITNAEQVLQLTKSMLCITQTWHSSIQKYLTVTAQILTTELWFHVEFGWCDFGFFFISTRNPSIWMA